MQEQFIRQIQARIPENHSIIDDVAAVLNISYDAAYRRINSRTSLSLEDGITLAKHYKISLNKLYEVGDQNTIMAEKSNPIRSAADLENYFTNSYKSIEPLTKLKSASIIYSAKDIPIFYTLTNSILTKYKFYVWLKFLNEDGAMERMTFEAFLNVIPSSLLNSALELSQMYSYINVVEFWNDNTVNGTLQQILYYFDSNLLSKTMALQVCEDLKKVVDHVEEQAIKQVITNSKNNASYDLYKSDLLTMSNTVMVKTQHHKLFFTPFTVLSYFRISHPPTCEEMHSFFKKQMKNSKLLINSGEKDRSQFFNRMRQKIQTVINRINLDQDLMIF
ncbi:MAG: hypothetical protein AAF489_00820 [Bacteroidota bacterium]